MANPIVNLTYIGQPGASAAGGQVIADQTSGPKAKTLYAYGTLVASSSTFSTTTAATVNFIDGVQTFGVTSVLALQSVTAPATINGTANTAIYSTVYGVNKIHVGDSVVIAGFTNSGNNGTFTVTEVTSSGFYVVNSSSVAETNPAATVSDTQNAIPAWVDVFYAGSNGDSAAAAAIMATATVAPTGVVATSFQLHYPSLATTGATVTIGAIIAFSS